MELLFEDASLIVCLKPAGLLSQAGAGESLLSLLEAQTGGEVFPVHRLDRETSGLMVYARTKAAAAALSESVREGRLEKTYLCVCHGAPPEKGEWTDLLFHDEKRNKTFVANRLRRGVKEAKLAYAVLSRSGENGDTRALCRVRLFTGRTHQIRVQFASRGFPLVGDRKYGARDGEKRLALFCASLSFPHPETGERMVFTAEPEFLLNDER